MGSLLERELIKKDFDEKYPLIVKMIDKELDTAKSIYDEQMAAKKEGGKAVLHKNMPKVSGSLRWAQELRERITAPMGNFKALDRSHKPASVKIKRVNSPLLKWACTCVPTYGVSHFRGHYM